MSSLGIMKLFRLSELHMSSAVVNGRMRQLVSLYGASLLDPTSQVTVGPFRSVLEIR